MDTTHIIIDTSNKIIDSHQVIAPYEDSVKLQDQPSVENDLVETIVVNSPDKTSNLTGVVLSSTDETTTTLTIQQQPQHTQGFVMIEGVMELNNQSREVVNSIARKESEILSMFVFNNSTSNESSEAVKNVSKQTQLMEEVTLLDQTDVDTGQDDIALDNNEQQSINMECEDSGVVTMEFHTADAAWITLFDSFEFNINEGKIRGYVEGEKKFLCLWECFQTSTMSTFSVRSSDRYYKIVNAGEEGSVNGRILKGTPKWSRTPLIPFDGVPFVSIDRKYFGCRLGGSERKNQKKGKLKSSRTGHSVKVGCPAEADVLEVWRVPDLALPEKIHSSREKRRLKTRLLSKFHDYILLEKFSKRYYVTLPLITKHQNHPILDVQAGRLKVLHPKIIEQIYEIVSQGIYEKRVVKCMLHEYVKEFQKQLGIEIQLVDRSFYPTDRDIANHIRNARQMIKKHERASTAPEDIAIVNTVPANSIVISTGDHMSYPAVSSFAEIPTSNCDMTYDIHPDQNHTDEAFVENIGDSTNITNFQEVVEEQQSKSFLPIENENNTNTNTPLEEIVQNAVLNLIQNTPEVTQSVSDDPSNNLVTAITNDDTVTESGSILHSMNVVSSVDGIQNVTNLSDIEMCNQDTSSTVAVSIDSIVATTENVINPSLTSEFPINTTAPTSREISSCNEIPKTTTSIAVENITESQISSEIPVKEMGAVSKPRNTLIITPATDMVIEQKKKIKSWPQKPKLLQKQLDLKTLLKYEIDNSFSIINEALTKENDESKLKLILKKVKVLQRIVQGKELLKKRGKRCGIQAMVDLESLKENFD